MHMQSTSRRTDISRARTDKQSYRLDMNLLSPTCHDSKTWAEPKVHTKC